MDQYSKCTLGSGLIIFLGIVAIYKNIFLALILALITILALNRIEIEKRITDESFRADTGDKFCCLNKNGEKCYNSNCSDCNCVNPNDITPRSNPNISLAARFLERAKLNPQNFFG